MSQNDKLLPEDYTEPRCPFCTEQYEEKPPVRSIPLDRVLSKLDGYFGVNDYVSAEKHLLYWLDEAKTGRDLRGEFSLRNELMGLYRKVGNREKALENADLAVKLTSVLQIEDSVGAATAYVNAATVYKAFGDPAKALPLFERARTVYEKNLTDDGRLGGLYNNMALAYVDLKMFPEALGLYGKALGVMSKVKNGELEMAITHLNIANALEAEKGLEDAAEEISECLDKAEKLLETPSVPRNGYYAFVCEKCAPTFGYYGRFFYEKELKERSEKIYAGT